MKIIQVSTTALGGAGIAAYRLHKGLRLLGADSWMLVNKKSQGDDRIICPSNYQDKLLAHLSPRLDKIPGHFSTLPMAMISSSWMPNRLVTRINDQAPDVVNLHWVNHGFMRIESLPKIDWPVVWTLHDMWAFSGGEHYVGASQRYKEGYSAANRPSTETGLDVNRWIWKRKKKSWSRIENMVIVTPSKWLARCAGESYLFKDHRIEVLPNGVDHERFHPMEHETARNILGLPLDKKLILFGAGSSTSDKRKGFHLLVDALKRLELDTHPDDYQLVVFGASSGENSFSMKTHYLGTLRDEISMALVYAAADVFVAPSVEDNLPNTVLESLSCGTPVVSFDVGGMADMVSHKINGYLAHNFDIEELANGMLWVLEDKQRWRNLSVQARDTIVQSFTLEISAARYLDLYQAIV